MASPIQYFIFFTKQLHAALTNAALNQINKVFFNTIVAKFISALRRILLSTSKIELVFQMPWHDHWFE